MSSEVQMPPRNLLELGNRLSKYVVGAEGNISCKNKEDSFVIKASGCSMANMTNESVITCDLDGNKVSEGKGRPSMEVSFHSWLYRNTDCKVIAHTHPTNVMKILCGGLTKLFASTRLFPDQVVFNDTSACVVPYATPGEDLVKEISYATEKHGRSPKLILLENHGIICCAKDFNQALTMTQICDKAAEIFVSIQPFSPSYLTEEQVHKIVNHESEIYRRSL